MRCGFSWYTLTSDVKLTVLKTLRYEQNIYLTLSSKATYNHRHNYREQFRVKCLAQAHIDQVRERGIEPPIF